MKPLSPTARRLVDLSRALDEPDGLAQTRVARSLAARIASGADVGAAGTSIPATAAATSGLGVASVGLGPVIVKSIVVACVTGAVATTGWVGLRSHRAAPVAPPHAPAPMVVPPVAVPAQSPAPAPMPESPAQDVGAHRKPVRLAPRPEPKIHAPIVSQNMDQLRDETEALRSVQQALRDGQAVQALGLLDAQDLHFRDGVLQQERAAARVLALCQTGSVSRARAQAESFERRWPRSSLIARIRFACWKP